MKKITMNEIAKLSGFSLKTVSRVINNSKKVKAETKEKVLAVVQKYDYNVNILAKWLREKKTNIIIIFVGEESLEHWSVWRSMMIQKMIKESKNKGYRIIVSTSSPENNSNNNSNGFDLLKSGMADGAIIFDSVESDSRIKYLRKNKIPFVIFGKDLNFTDTNYIDLNNYKAGYIGGKHLIECGYKKICTLVGNEKLTVYRERLQGFCDAYKTIKHIKHISKTNVDDMLAAYKIAKRAINEDKADAFFVMSGDGNAHGVYSAIHEMGLNIPDDIAVLGINNIELCDFINPPLSSIDQSNDEFVHCTFQLLLDLLNGEVKTCKQILIEPKLIIRKST